MGEGESSATAPAVDFKLMSSWLSREERGCLGHLILGHECHGTEMRPRGQTTSVTTTPPLTKVIPRLGHDKR